MGTGILLESGTNELEILEFTVGGNRYGINVEKVEEIIGECEIQPVPKSKPFVEGVFRRRGKIYTAIDLASYLNLERSRAKSIFLITYFNHACAAFRVDDIKTIHRLSWTDIQEPDGVISGEQNSLVTGIAKLGDDEMILILDFEKMLFDINPDTGLDERAVKKQDAGRHAHIRMLIAEDSALLRKMLVECLEKAGFQNIMVKNNGQEAWDQLLKCKNEGDVRDQVSCIITDIEMPQMDGMTLTKKIKEDGDLRMIPVIIFSSMINEANSQKCTEVGANAQLTKPDIAKLVACIDEMMST